MVKFDPNSDEYKVQNIEVSTTINGKEIQWDLGINQQWMSPVELEIKNYGKLTAIVSLYDEYANVFIELRQLDENLEPLSKNIKYVNNNVQFDAQALLDEHLKVPVETLSELSTEVNGEFYEERDCRYCGSPMGVYPISEKQYVETHGPKDCEFHSLMPKEAVDWYGVDIDKVRGVVLTESSSCNCCRQH